MGSLENSFRNLKFDQQRKLRHPSGDSNRGGPSKVASIQGRVTDDDK